MEDCKVEKRKCCPNVTVFIRCTGLRNRGELVNHFLFQNREKLGIANWYRDNLLLHSAPVEVVEVKNSRKPYFLIEFRPPLEEEMQKKKSFDLPCENQCEWTDDELLKVPVLLLSLGEEINELNGSPLTISQATAGISVAQERRKLEVREARSKRERSHDDVVDHFTKSKDHSLSLVPRSVRRRL